MEKVQKEYKQLKLKQEAELKQLEEKLKIAKISAGVSPETETEAHGEIKLREETNIPGQKTDDPIKKALQLLNASLPKHNFNISGQTVEPGQNEKLNFVSLTHQIDYSIKKGYQESDIINAVIRAILLHSNLRSYIEMLLNMTLSKLQKILRLHYHKHTAPELYQELSLIRQNPKETVPQFLFRALNLRNKVLFASQEDVSKFDYGLPLIQNIFLKSLETGFLMTF